MSLSVEDLTERLQWFITAYPRKYRIRLSFAHRTIEKALGERVNAALIYEYLKITRYKHIEVDLDVSPNPLEQKMLRDEHANTKQENEEWDNIDDLLNQPLVPNETISNTDKIEEVTYVENNRLLQEYHRTGSTMILKQIIAANMKLVHSVANKCKSYMNHDLSIDDLIHEGVFGLKEAIDKYDHTYGGQLSTYATHWIHQRIIRAIGNTGTTVRVPIHMLERIRRIKKFEARINSDKADSPTPIDEVCAALEITIEQYYDAKLVEHRFLAFTSLNQSVGEGEHESELLDFIPNDRLEVISSLPQEFLDPVIVVEQRLVQQNIQHVLDTLTERQRLVIEYRFGLIDGHNRTLEEVGKLFGLTRERIRQIEAKALRRLRGIRNKQKWIWIY